MADAQKLAKALQSTISNQPRSNRMLGMIADALKPVQQYASKVNIPIVDENLSDFTGLTGTQSLADDMSYGKPLFSGGSLQTSQIDPRAMDVAGFAPTAGAAIKPVAKSYGKMLAKELGRQMNDGTTLGKMIDPRMNISETNIPYSENLGTKETLKRFYRKMQGAYDESFEPDEAYKAIKELGLSNDENLILNALQRENNLGFDYPHQSVYELLKNPESWEVYPSTKSILSKIGNKEFK